MATNQHYHKYCRVFRRGYCLDNLEDGPEIENLRDNLKKAEDDITYMFRLDYEESRRAAGKVRRDVLSTKTDTDKGKQGDIEG
jgi:hypothetical protein